MFLYSSSICASISTTKDSPLNTKKAVLDVSGKVSRTKENLPNVLNRSSSAFFINASTIAASLSATRMAVSIICLIGVSPLGYGIVARKGLEPIPKAYEANVLPIYERAMYIVIRLILCEVIP